MAQFHERFAFKSEIMSVIDSGSARTKTGHSGFTGYFSIHTFTRLALYEQGERAAT